MTFAWALRPSPLASSAAWVSEVFVPLETGEFGGHGVDMKTTDPNHRLGLLRNSLIDCLNLVGAQGLEPWTR
jgi:hypothetical protein